jgi:hypothetical protein
MDSQEKTAPRGGLLLKKDHGFSAGYLGPVYSSTYMVPSKRSTI